MEAAVEWLLASDEPGIRLAAKRDLLGKARPREVSQVLEGGKVRSLLAGQQEDGGFGVHPYGKWRGAHWRLVSLVELGVPAGEPRCVAAAGTVLGWLTGPGHRRGIRAVNGLVRRCASQEGNALAVCCRLGLADDRRVRLLAESLLEWQWPDGGWNCDLRASGRRSSFHESLPPMWGLYEVWRATGDEDARRAANRTAELFLEHRLFRSLASGEAMNPSFTVLHYPPYWHYDVSAGARGARSDGPSGRSASSGGGRAAGAEAASHRTLALGRTLVEAAGLHRQQRRGGRLGPHGPQRDDHVERAARPQDRA